MPPPPLEASVARGGPTPAEPPQASEEPDEDVPVALFVMGNEPP
jgi:hypothetical protein